jgi:carboxylesterase
MSLGFSSADIKTDKVGLPFFLSGGETAVLLLHGYTGISDEMRYLAERLAAAGFSVSVPRLPGHGTTGHDFLSTTADDWFRRAADEFFDLRGRFKTVYVVGLSMGALLALLLASRFKPDKIVLGAPAITNTDKRILLTPFMKIFRKVLPRKGYEYSGLPEYSGIAETYWSKEWPREAAELLSLQRRSRRALPRVTADILLIVSEKDLTVPLKAADIIENAVSSSNLTRVVLKESGHVVFNGSEKEYVADLVVAWLSKGGAGLGEVL